MLCLSDTYLSEYLSLFTHKPPENPSNSPQKTIFNVEFLHYNIYKTRSVLGKHPHKPSLIFTSLAFITSYPLSPDHFFQENSFGNAPFLVIMVLSMYPLYSRQKDKKTQRQKDKKIKKTKNTKRQKTKKTKAQKYKKTKRQKDKTTNRQKDKQTKRQET